MAISTRASARARTSIVGSFGGNLDYAAASVQRTIRVLEDAQWRDHGAVEVRQRSRRGVRTYGHFVDRSGPVSDVEVDVVFRVGEAEAGRFTTKTREDRIRILARSPLE